MVITERSRDIAGFFGELAFFIVGMENLGFDFCSAFLIDGVGNVDVESWATTCVFWRTGGIQTLPAFIAIDSPEVVLAVALAAPVQGRPRTAPWPRTGRCFWRRSSARFWT